MPLEGDVEDGVILLLSRGVPVRAQVRHGSFWPNGDRRDVYAAALERKRHRLARWIEDNIPAQPIVDIVRPPLPDDAATAADRGQTGTPSVR